MEAEGKEVSVAFLQQYVGPCSEKLCCQRKRSTGLHADHRALGESTVGKTLHPANGPPGLESMLKNPKTRSESSKFPRWLQRLQEFDYEVQYLPGPENKLPDYLSRLRERATNLNVHVTKERLRRAYEEDPFAQEFVEVVQKGDWGHWKNGDVRATQFLRPPESPHSLGRGIRHEAKEDLGSSHGTPKANPSGGP